MQTILPTTLAEALDALDEHPDATILSGGTDLMVSVNSQRVRPETVVGVRRVPELDEWDGSFLGAGVNFRRMEHGPIKSLAQAARTVGSPQIRAAGTLGGNLGTASPAGDGLVVLAALDAEIVLRSKAGERTLPWKEFLVGPKKNTRQPGELITGVRFPDPLPSRHEFAKVGVRNAMVIAITACCVSRTEDGTTTVALGSVGPTTLRTPRAEELASNEKPSPAMLDEFQRLVSEEVTPITDHRSTEQYRRHASGVVARRLLERVLA
jgi:CO/xanthine dehydrogenase FAD-binding subunit